jgi:hypothetical protein
MVIFKKRCYTREKRFQNRETVIIGGNEITRIGIDDTEVICNSCNSNIHTEDLENLSYGYLIYLSKTDLKKDTPYDIYCINCVKRCFPKAIDIDEQNKVRVFE